VSRKNLKNNLCQNILKYLVECKQDSQAKSYYITARMQKRLIRITHGRAVVNMSYEKTLARSQLESLSHRTAAK